MTADDLKGWRAELGWTQAKAAAMLGITPPHYRRLESGRTPLSEVYRLACESLKRGRSSEASHS